MGESNQHFPVEAGGILIGHFGKDTVHIAFATDSGPNAQHSPTGFRRDGEYSQTVLEQIVGESEAPTDYIGEWHSHPANQGPSLKDLVSMQWIAKNPKYAVSHPVLGLCVRETADQWVISFYQLYKNSLVKLKIESSQI